MDLLHAKMPPRTRKRESLMQLRPRHLDQVDSLARSKLSMTELRDFLCKHYVRMFGPLRPKRKQVPSDELRQSFMVFEPMELVQRRRWWLERYAQLMET